MPELNLTGDYTGISLRGGGGGGGGLTAVYREGPLATGILTLQ